MKPSRAVRFSPTLSLPSHPELTAPPEPPTDYPALFPLARTVVRSWTLYVGPTNSGKTHAALTHLKQATRGAYLAPLRLMALENADALIEAGLPCHLRTGEEYRPCEGAQHVASTIEMVDLQRWVDVAVVDEVQWLLDADRGWAWTQALVGLPAGHLVLTGSPECEGAVRALADRLGEPLTVERLERKVPLNAMRRPVAVRELRAGDAVVVFSRRAALDWRETLLAQGKSVATLYGALGPEVRRAEARRFREGRAEILVATDAIGMGLNLPIQRVFFAEATKYDGTARRPLLGGEWRQIAGRAGRFGLSAQGEASVLTTTPPLALKSLQQALQVTPKIKTAGAPFVWLPWSVLALFEHAVRKPGLTALLMHAHAHALDPADWQGPDLEGLLPLAKALDRTDLPMEHRHRYLGCPADPESPVFEAVTRWAERHGQGDTVPWWDGGWSAQAFSEHSLVQEERVVNLASAYLWLAQRWPKTYVDAHKARQRQARANTFIEDVLAHDGEKLCTLCGRPMSQRHHGRACHHCVDQRKTQHHLADARRLADSYEV
jgi:ATP-dependent RNA helicase SUPV3L1/SUV3